MKAKSSTGAKRLHLTTLELKAGDYILSPAGHILIESISTEKHFFFGEIRCLHRSYGGHPLEPMCWQDAAEWDVLR